MANLQTIQNPQATVASTVISHVEDLSKIYKGLAIPIYFKDKLLKFLQQPFLNPTGGKINTFIRFGSCQLEDSKACTCT